ncbi:MAG: hypothetical protein ACIAQZ_12030 [Sedimentisphaeraceae bacterium JB056]
MIMNQIENLKIIHEKLENWWNFGPQSSPLLLASVLKDDHSPLPDTDDLKKYWTDVDFIIERNMRTIDATNYYGVAVPFHYIDFSASAMPCALGGEIEYVNKDTVWSHPVFDNIGDVLSVSLSEDNIAYYAQVEALRRSVKLAKGHHYVSNWSFGGLLDTISGLYGAEELLMDLVISPDKVKEAVDYLLKIWIDEFNKIAKMIEACGNSGHICNWTGIWAPGTTFPIQEDFAYMISPDMFGEFCLPAVRKMVEAMDYPLFHLDGTGMLGHLDMLLGIDKLKAVQWQPGAGRERLDQWYDVIRKILDSGKSCQVFAEPDEIKPLVDNVGTRGLLAIVKNVNNEQMRELEEIYG